MQTYLDPKLALQYNSNSQKIRIMSENWVEQNGFCANCANKLFEFENNRPVADFYCANCNEEFELKSKGGSLGKKVNAGAYSEMIKRLASPNNPHFFFLNYEKAHYRIINFLVVPNYFFVPQIIEKRKALSKTAKRAGWVGCNILLSNIPQSGKIFYIKDKSIISKQVVLDNWQKTQFLNKTKSAELRGWILDIMNCIDKVGKKDFSLEEIYAFEAKLKEKHPKNRHVKDKIRQQLQFLRDKKYIKFLGKGKYQLS